MLLLTLFYKIGTSYSTRRLWYVCLARRIKCQLRILTRTHSKLMFCSTPTTKPTTEEEDKNQQPPPAPAKQAASAGWGDGQWWMMTTMTTATAAVYDHGGATPSPPAVPDCRRICVSLPPGAVGGVRPSGDDQRTGPPADSRCRHRRRRRRRWTTAMGTATCAVGSALTRMLLDDTTAASASAPDSDGLDSLDESLGRGGACTPSFPSPAAAVIAFEHAVSRRLPRSAAVGRPVATMASGK